MTAAARRAQRQLAAPPPRRQPGESRAEASRRRRLAHFERRFQEAATPVAGLAVAYDHMRAALARFDGDPRRAWTAIEQVSTAIVRAAVDLEENLAEEGAQQ